ITGMPDAVIRRTASSALASPVKRLRRDSDRKTLTAILEFLNQHERFISEAEDRDVDAIICESDESGTLGAAHGRAEICSLADFQFTDFEQTRSMSAHGGLTLGFGQMSTEQLLETHFRRALQYARRIQIYDGSLGQNCNENYRHTVESFLAWFRQTNRLGDQCAVEIHCREPAEGEKKSECQALLRGIRALGVEMTCYRFLPHDRFILTDQFALEIGRGMDFLEPKRGCNRDVSIATKDLRQMKKLMRDYARHRLPGS
ncbi:MAG: hypothetical protein ABI680_19530, partial [Chthoniobacteraceae bacterium]